MSFTNTALGFVASTGPNLDNARPFAASELASILQKEGYTTKVPPSLFVRQDAD
jgi:hypothetical protein